MWKNLDIFGPKFNFFMNGTTNVKTIPGFVCTILATSIIVSSFVLLYLIMVDTSVPVFEITQRNQHESGAIVLG